MKRQWDIEDLIEHFTFVGDDLDALANKTGPTRLGYALLLKCFQYEGRFPAVKHDIPKSIVDYVAHQLKLDPALYAQYDWEGRTIKGHRAQIREHLTFREATVADTYEKPVVHRPFADGFNGINGFYRLYRLWAGDPPVAFLG